MNAISKHWSPTLGINPKLRLRLGRALVYVLIFVFVTQLARLLLLALSGPGLPPAVIPPLPEWREGPVASSQGLGQWHLFGEAPVGFDLSAFAQLPDTPLKLTLRGIVAGSGRGAATQESGETVNEGYAMIADEHGKEDVYRRGDEVPGGAKVLSVQADQVILLRSGKRETLRLPGGQLSTGASAGGNALAGVGGNRQVGVPPAVANLPGIRKPGQAISASAAVPQLSGLRVDAAALANSVQIAPVSGGGFRVFPGRNAQIFTRLGLQANDVVTQVNGKPITSQADALAIFQQVQNGQALSITVRRGEREVVLKPDLKTLLSNQP